MHARVVDHCPTTTFHTVSLSTSVNKAVAYRYLPSSSSLLSKHRVLRQQNIDEDVSDDTNAANGANHSNEPYMPFPNTDLKSF
jgi:hypothetical protein